MPSIRKIPVPILLAAALMLTACLVVYLPKRFGTGLVSTAGVPLRQPLAEFPEQLGPYVKVGEERLTAEVERSLGTRDYIFWTYRDTRVAPGTGPDAIRFQFAYWSGTKQILSTGVHYPELCYTVGGANAVMSKTVKLDVSDGGSAASVPVRLFQFAPAGQTDLCTVGYFFLFNGRYMTSADLLRIATFFGPTRSMYYCKLEMMPATLRKNGTPGKAEFEGGVSDPATAERMMREFLTHALPEVKKHLPSD